jgi:hypothetical protein
MVVDEGRRVADSERRNVKLLCYARDVCLGFCNVPSRNIMHA